MLNAVPTPYATSLSKSTRSDNYNNRNGNTQGLQFQCRVRIPIEKPKIRFISAYPDALTLKHCCPT